jgi:hypothetical protein
LDAWHGILISAVGSLVTAIGILWKHSNTIRKQQDAQSLLHSEELAKVHAEHDRKLEALHAEHKADIRELTQAALELGTAVTVRMLPPPGSES